jgi:hypothetical protein
LPSNFAVMSAVHITPLFVGYFFQPEPHRMIVLTQKFNPR